jgi:hypothetical protein
MASKGSSLAAIRQPADRAVLERLHLTGIDEVWREIGKDLDGLEPLIDAGVDRAQLIRDLMECAARDADARGESWPRQHFFNLLLTAGALGFAVLLAWAIPRASAVGIALHDLRSGERVSADSLHGADPDQIADRQLTRDVRRGGYVWRGWLAPVPALSDHELQGRNRLSLHLRADDLRLLPRFPARATLAVSFAGQGAPNALLLRDVPVLAAEKTGESATIDAAFTDAELQSILPLLPHAEIHVVARVPAKPPAKP